MTEEKDIRVMVDEDIALAKAVWAASSYDSEVMGELFYHLMERYQNEIEDFMKGLKVIQSDEDTAELAEIYRGNIRVMMERLKGFRGNGYSNEGLMEYYIVRDRQELNFQADFITVRLELGLMEISQGEREDIMRHLDEMEEIFAGKPYQMLSHFFPFFFFCHHKRANLFHFVQMAHNIFSFSLRNFH